MNYFMPILAKNKKAYFDYEILQTLEAGLVLTGAEVKSLRRGHINFQGAFISIQLKHAYLKQAHIGHYPYAAQVPGENPERERKLLLHAKEIAYLRSKLEERGLTVIPLSLYTKGPRIKLEIAIAKGKKTYDKRESIKKRERQREDARIAKER